jgi:hypothetical protein
LLENDEEPKPMTEFNQIKSGLNGVFKAHNFQKEDGATSGGFGDQYEVYLSKDFKLRLVSDRGQISIDLSPSGQNEWHDLGLFFSIVNKVPYVRNEIVALVKFLESQYEEISFMLSEKNWQGTQNQVKRILASRV